MKPKRKTWSLVAAFLSAVVALLGALNLQGRVRTVDILQLFFGGAGAGAGIATAFATARRPRPNIFPAMKYHDGPAARAWLERVFGFSTQLEMPNSDGTIAHAELRFGPGIVMLGSVGKPDTGNPWATSQGLYVYVADVDAHYARARQAGAEIVRELHDTSYGAREYSAKDLEGQLWSFGTYYPEENI
jgi:uncharacterized glyoxalase superfamily protein PhnB